jgi:hypothetical protein
MQRRLGRKIGKPCPKAGFISQQLYYEYFLYPVDRANTPSRKIPEALGGKVAREYEYKKMSGNILDLLGNSDRNRWNAYTE